MSRHQNPGQNHNIKQLINSPERWQSSNIWKQQ